MKNKVIINRVAADGVMLVSKTQRVVCCVVRASLGSILLSILSSAIVWLQTTQLEKK